MKTAHRSPFASHLSTCLAPALYLVAAMACQPASPPAGMTADPVPSAMPPSPTPVPGGTAVQTGAPAPGAGAVHQASSSTAAAPPQASTKAQQVYAQRCALCHGPHGVGNGVAAENLKPKPRNLQDPSWQSAVADADIRAIIVKGGAGVGKSMMMPANPDLAESGDTLEGLVRIVRSFAK